jgi:DNA damage-binding protein 1
LDELEHALCIVSMSFSQEGDPTAGGDNDGNGGNNNETDTTMRGVNENENNSKSYFVVGTASSLEDEIEPSKGRILVFEVLKLEGEERRLVLVTEKTTKGAVYELCPFGGKLLAGINAKVQLYRWNDRSTGAGSSQQPTTTTTTTSTTQTPRGLSSGGGGGSVDLLSQECGYHGHTLSLFIRSHGNDIVVGDLIKSVSLLYWDPEKNLIEERARDLNATWVSALAVLDGTTYLSADTSTNMIVYKPDQNMSPDEPGRLLIDGEFHWGDYINVFCKGSLVMRQKEEEDNANSTSPESSLVVRASPKLLFGTSGGAIGVLATLTRKEFVLLDRIQLAMNIVLDGIGGQKHSEWRAFRTNTKTHPSKGFIDGDLIEMLLEMNHSEVEKVVGLINRGLADKATGTSSIVTDEPPIVTVSSLISLVEELTRLH